MANLTKLVKTLFRRMIGSCPQCGSKNLDVRVEGTESTVIGENFPAGSFYADWRIETGKATRYCKNCGYEKYLGKITTKSERIA